MKTALTGLVLLLLTLVMDPDSYALFATGAVLTSVGAIRMVFEELVKEFGPRDPLDWLQ